ncbi:unnamed protein product [Danaus chrysippus]|uniref:(African queen) hypothetical protein n=1 Tax=Danaus chrysippus TaxID=151541 RepID=A0A8J2QGR9_9NEOP|nr:unnamed protein product [Danaus chrysippus]
MSEEDKIENIIGRFGKYQRWILFLVTISRLPTDYQLVNVVFLLPNVQYTCLDEEAYNQTNHCPCKNPQYDLSDIGNSVTSTFGLICEKRHLASLAQSTLQAGILVGSIFYGYLSDRYGRKIAVSAALFCEVVFVSLSAVTTHFWLFVATRFLMGTAVGGTMLCAFIMLVELSGKSFRPYLAGMIDLSLVISYLTLPIISYFLRDWRKLQLVLSLPWLYVALIYFVLPESPRWLITTGQKDKAVEILSYIAKWNNRSTENIRAVVENLVCEEEIRNRQQQHVIGQAGALTAFDQIYLYSSEVFPTIIRNSAMGFASVFARFGGFVAPFVVNIGTEWISIVIFSLLASFGGISCYFLPETKGKVLLNTIDETEKCNKFSPSTDSD